MMTRTDRRRFPILLAVIAALAMAMLFSPVQAQEVSAPDQPSGLDATATHGQVVLSWDDPEDESITGYVILRRVRVNDTGGDFSVLVANTETAALTYTDDTVAASLTYTYRIKAINEHGVSERSRWFHIDVPAAPQSKSEYIDANNERERALEELLAQTDPLNPDAGDTEEEDDEREAGKQGKSVGTQQGRSSHTVDICDRTPEVEAALLAFIQANQPSATCSTVTDAQLASVNYLNVLDGYSSSSIMPSDFAGLTGLVELQVAYSQQLTTVPANAFRELRSTTVLGYIGLSGNRIKTVHPDAFDGLNFSTVRKSIPGIALNGNVIETLPASVFDNVTGLQSIDLNYNHITGFEDGVFAGLNELKRLYLSRNHIKVLPDGLFDGLTALESLHLSFNDLTALEADTFADLSNLETLDISRGQIASLDADSFKGLTALETLDLQRNAIPALPAAVFDDLDNLSVLRLTLNNISSLNANTLSGLTNITELYLGGNNLASLPGDSFQNLISLTTLDLQANDLTSVDEGLFSGLADLEVLRLDGNQLSALPEDLFDPLDDSLTLLYLHANVLTALPEDIFDGLDGLERLALDENQLTTLPADIFDPLDDNLVFLWLGDNSFSSLPVDLFDGLQPGYLWIPAAGLTALDADLFEPLGSNLILLDLSNNDLTSLDASVFDDLTGIVFLYLHGNELTTLHADVFDGLGLLARLYLDGNELTTLPADVFDGLGALGRLNLDENELTALPANLFEDLDESLTDLYLRQNELAALPSGVFSGLGGLQRLDLSCNALTTLDLEVFDPFAGTLKYLDLGANSFTTPPTVAAVRAKLTELVALYLTGNTPCLPAYDVGLSALSLSTGTLNTAFVPPGRSQYQATVGHDVSQLTITATTRNPDAVIGPSPGGDIVNDEDPNTPGIQATLNPISTTVRWQVIAKNRDSSLNKNYTVLVIREHPPGSVARLRSLEVSGLTLTPEFSSTTYDYEAEVPESTTQTSITAIPIDPDAEVAITVDGVSAGADGTVDILPDSRTVTVEVTAEDGMTTQTYTVGLLQPSADASLSSLSLSGITLDPDFSAKATSYTASVESTVTSTTVTAETTDEDATAAIMINDQEDADGTVDLVAGYNDITVVVTAQDGTTTQSYTVTVLRAAPEDASTSDSKTITSLLSRLDAELRDTVINSYHNQTVGYDPADSQGRLSPAWFNYPAGFSPSYTVERLIVGQEGAGGDIAATDVVLRVRGTVVSTSGTKAPVLPADADITLHLEGDNFTRSYSLNNPESRTDSGCFVENDPNNSERPCKVGELGKSLYVWRTNLPPLLADGESILVRLRYTAPRPGTPGRPLVTAPEGKSGALVVNWIAPASNDPKVRGYEIQVSPAPGETRASGVTKTTGASTTRLPVLLLEPNTAYDVRVRVRTNLTTGPWSGTARARTNPLQGANMPQVTLDLNGITRVKEGDGLPKRLKVTGMPNLHLGAFPEVLDGYDQSNFGEFRVLDGIADSFTYADHPGGGSVGAFYAGALTIGEDGEVYHDKGYLVIPEGMSAYGPLYIWLGRAGTSPEDGSTVVNTREVNIGSTARQCVEIADSSNNVPSGRNCPSGGMSGHAVDRLTARFQEVPRSHDGESEFTLRVAFIEDVGISPTSLREDALTVTGGTVTQAQRVDDRSDLFEITVEPASDEDVTITLPAGSDCAVAGAICTEGEDPRKLYNSPAATVSGPTLTASFQGLPSQHDGETAFSFRIAFNDDIATGEEEFRDHSVEVWGGRVTRAQPVDQRRDLWEVEVEPASDDLVMISLRPSLSCDETGAVCTAGGRRLSVSPATMVAGPATWPVQVNGEAQVGKTLTADTSNISDRFGVQVTSMTYQWLANNVRIPGASGQSYTLGEGKQGRKISVMATFTDDRGNEDTLTSAPTDPVAARERNNRATGLPLISGRALVGQTLTADTSLIFDADGLENSVLSYLWEADDDSIPGANDPTYTPVQADVGKVITVIVSFLDDAGYGQSMTSPDTMAVTTAEAAAKVGFAHSLRYAANADGSVSLYWNAPDDYGVTGYRIDRRRYSMGEPKGLVYVEDTGSAATTYTDTEVTAGVPHSYRVQAIRGTELGEKTKFFKTKVFPLRKAANSPAAGAPAISGVAQVGETLTADTSGIVDADGLENVTQNYLWGINKGLIIGAVYGYQWLADEAEIEDATGSTYILADVDEGKAIKVRVSFTDDGGHRETLTSAATAAVAQPNAPATGLPTVSGKAWVGETLTVDTSGISDENGLDDATFTHLWITDDSVVVSTGTRAYTPTGGDQGKAIKVRVSFSDDAGNWETRTSAQTEAVEARANSPATGLPTITGTAVIGETLMADTSGIQDANGLDNVAFHYQWLGDDTAIDRAAGITYTLADSDKGKTIRVRVTFTDDVGNEETLTSAASGAVLEETVFGDGPPGAPRNLTVTAGDQEITLSWEPPADNGNAPATRYRIEWRIDGKDYKKGHWGPSGETTYTKTDLANGVKYIFRVKAENGNGNSYGPYGPASEEVSATPTSGLAVDLGTPVLSNTKTLHHGMVKLDWEDVEDAGWYVVQYYHVKGGEWLDLPGAGVDIAFHGSSAVVSNLHGLSWLRVRAMSCAGESEWSQIEELYGTNASDWEGVPVPEVEEGDEIEPCPVVLGTPVLSNTKPLHHGMVKLDWQDIKDAGWYVVQYYHVKSGEWLDLPAAGVDVAFHGSSAVVSNLHGLSWLRVGAASCDGASEWSQIEELYGTNASDWEGVPVPEVAEGDEIEPCSEDGDTTDNSPATGAPAISGTAQVGETLTANTSGVADADGLSNVQYEYQWLADDSDISGATNATYTLVAEDEGKAIKVKVSFTDDAGNQETLTSVATDAVTAELAHNNPATGALAVTGAAQVGETLTANTSRVADVDGLSNVQYEYQWLADDSDISGATNATYTLAAADEGKAIKVEVTFTDDAGNDESLTSAATDVVEAAPTTNSPATGAPTISGTAQVGETLTADKSGIADADDLTSATYSYQWLADDAEIAGANGSTYTLVAEDEGKAIKVQVSFTDDAGNNEALTSAATGAVSAAQPTEPPAMPTGLSATASLDSVTLTWDDPGDDSITGYVILRRVRENDVGGDFSELVADTGTAATTYTDDTVAAGTTYTYRIKAINGAGTSERSRWFHIDTPAAPVPDKPTGLSATASHDVITLTWEDPGDDSITGYVILRRLRYDDPSGHFDELVADTGTAATTYTDDTVKANTHYTYRIKAISGAGVSERSRWFHIHTQEAP